MQIGFCLPQMGPQATRENLVRVAKRAEELGYDSLWVLERLLWPISPKAPYPPTPDGSLPEVYQNVFDPVETLTFVSAITTNIKLGTSIIIMPCHNPVIMARRLATLDVLSNGRLILGVGLGWSPDEFEAAGVPFERLGARGDEFLQVLKEIWTEDVAEFNGEFFHLPKSKIGPKPVQNPHPPIYVGGFTPKTLERVVKYANGWNPAGGDFNYLTASIKSLRDMAKQMSRDPDEIKVALRTLPRILDSKGAADRGPVVGTLDEIRSDIQRFAEIGIDHLFFDLNFSLRGGNIMPMLDAMEQLIQVARI